MLQRRKNKKGFMLVELLAVIAIIAILVSIAVPIIQKENIKSAAAANAANLRSIVGKLATMKASDDNGFDASYHANAKKAGQIITNGVGPFLRVMGWEKFDEWANELLYEITADPEGKLYWYDSNNVILAGVPAAKGLSVMDSNNKSLTISEGARMTVYISDNTISACYYTNSGDKLGIEDFADIAEDGVYNGTVTNTSGNTGDFWTDVGNTVDMVTCKLQGNHAPDPKKECYCENCHQQDHVRSSNSFHYCECGEEFHKDHTEGWDDNYECDYNDCSVVIHPENHVHDGSGGCEVPGCGAYKKPCSCTKDQTGCKSGCDQCTHGKHPSVHYEDTWIE